MLLMLAQWLSQDIRGFNVFNYITLRAVLATLTSGRLGAVRRQGLAIMVCIVGWGLGIAGLGVALLGAGGWLTHTEALWGALEAGLTDACRNGAQLLAGMWGHPDQEEGPLAFAEKRAPKFQGR